LPWLCQAYELSLCDSSVAPRRPRAQVGRISSLFPLMYGCSKFASGVAVDVLGSRAVFAAGLVLSGLVNLACGSTTSFVVMSGLWAANGFFQGFGGPACAKLLTQWIPIKERGFWCARCPLPLPEGPQGAPSVSNLRIHSLPLS
jgi:sugar phosphate permease